jgi:hypothetical protein
VRAWLVLALLAGCLHGPPYKLSVTEAYEVGEDATVGVQAQETTDDDAYIVITRPDGSTVKQHAPLDATSARVKFAPPVPRPRAVPTFTMKGSYRVELRSGAKVLASRTVEVTSDHLGDLIPDESVSDYKPITRFTRTRQLGDKQFKTYGASYEDAFHPDARVDVLIEEPGDAYAAAWKTYEDDGTLGVIDNSNVILKERVDSAQASWTSGKQIVSIRAPTLADLERGLIGHFLARFPSKLQAK